MFANQISVSDQSAGSTTQSDLTRIEVSFLQKRWMPLFSMLVVDTSCNLFFSNSASCLRHHFQHCTALLCP